MPKFQHRVILMCGHSSCTCSQKPIFLYRYILCLQHQILFIITSHFCLHSLFITKSCKWWLNFIMQMAGWSVLCITVIILSCLTQTHFVYVRNWQNLIECFFSELRIYQPVLDSLGTWFSWYTIDLQFWISAEVVSFFQLSVCMDEYLRHLYAWPIARVCMHSIYVHIFIIMIVEYWPLCIN